jgi:hypothetical protein
MLLYRRREALMGEQRRKNTLYPSSLFLYRGFFLSFRVTEKEAFLSFCVD